MADPVAGAQANTDTPEALHDAAITATEAWQANPADEALKTAATTATAKAKAAATKAKEDSAAKSKTDAEQKAKLYPDTYDLKVPDGSTLAPARIEEIAAYSKAQGFSATQAQALLDRETKAAATFQDNQIALLESEKVKWLDSTKADKEIGGDGFARNAEIAKRVIAKFGSESLKSALDNTGLGNHPELVRMLVRIGTEMKVLDGQFIEGGGSAGAGKSAADILYPVTEGGKKE